MAYRFTNDNLSLPVKLNEDEFFVLCLIAYFGSSLEDSNLYYISERRKIKVSNIKTIAKDLERSGLISQPYFVWGNSLGQIYPQYYFTAMLLMLDQHPEWVNFFERLATKPHDDKKFLFNVAKAIHSGDSKLISNIRLFPHWAVGF